MYKCFDVKLDVTEIIDSEFDEFLIKGRRLNESNKDRIKESIDKYLLHDGSLDGSKMQSNWFPQIESDIFISFSHNDEDEVIAFAGYLEEMFNLNVFIDSCVWKYANDLIRLLNNDCCHIYHDNICDTTTTDYNDLVSLTSHVHMMLSTALTMMIDRAECVFFFDTNESIIPKYIYDKKTYSPWLYHEISMTKLVKNRSLSEYREKRYDHGKIAMEEMIIEKDLRRITHNVSKDHLINFNRDLFYKWGDRYIPRFDHYEHSLDALYEILEGN
ncbi:MAG: hypothetical protein ABSG94_04635 [Brevinematales bacterium]|jgi:hypothetical protein